MMNYHHPKILTKRCTIFTVGVFTSTILNPLKGFKVILLARKRFFTESTVGNRNRLPRDVVMEPGLIDLKQHLYNNMRYMV